MEATDPPWADPPTTINVPHNTVTLTHRPTPTEHRPAASSTSAPSLTIPSSTVIGLGLGFVAAALSVVAGTVLFRVWQVQRSARRARAAGNPDATFRATWASWGGWWGMFFVQDEQGVWNRRLRVRVKNLTRPSIHDVLLPKDGEEADEFGASDQPLAGEARYGHDPRLAFSVLIRMPGEAEASRTQEEPELPELVLGTTYVPYPGDLSFETQEKEVTQVVSVEVLPAPQRQTGWGMTGWPVGWPPAR